ncbi:MAG TPA: saccharopine dehydrogenase NADP-binding domain-containing protein [Candidatus Omnitrophota bacterium]|nr:saccharopine dehydrogenase NADP-binding domain-containing protein [Candidatus Omnitrophota bacterium]HPS36279.1 saccharopine dehydrogenase NADP-binding domain-containing protein [Candidatus Omnitrophota bacterium]
MIDFKNKVLIIGFGSVGKCTLPILLKHLRIPFKNITVIDFADKRKELAPWIKKGIRYSQERLNPVNVARTLSKYVSPGGMVIDLAWNIDSLDMLAWCHDNKVLYINTSVEEWDPYANIEKKTPLEKSLYFKQMEIRKMTAKWNGDSTTAVLDHGANPGLISHFTKQALLDIAEKIVHEKSTRKAERGILERLIREEKFHHLSMKLGVKTIHVSERDTQITDRPKEVDEFVGTWSIEGLREEGTSPVEIGWGTHEKELPPLATIPDYGPQNQIFLSQMGMNTWVRSWVPNYEIVGMVIRHGEAFSISEKLTVWKKGRPVYRPTVHYVYMPCNETLSSLHELRCRNYELQPKCRIMSDEIIKGADILGSLVMGHRYNSWWTGSILTIEESRELVPHQNATTIQVAIGVVSAICWMVKNTNKGACVPDDLPHKEILETAKPYLGTFVSEANDWTPFENYQVFFRENPDAFLDKKNPWCCKNFKFKQ